MPDALHPTPDSASEPTSVAPDVARPSLAAASRLPTPHDRPKRRYTLSERARAANLANLAKALAVPKEIRLRNTPRREAARWRNIERAWARQRDPHSIPGGRFRHGACSKNLERTAPLAGEDREGLARLMARLQELFPPVTPELDHRLNLVGERIWRVQRVLRSRWHQERLEFYQALFQAAAGGVGLEGLAELAENLARALDFDSGELDVMVARLEVQQRGLQVAVEKWDKELKSVLGFKPWAGEMPRTGRPGRGELPPVWGEVTLAEWLAREFARRGWKLPEEGATGRRIHDWLVRAAVVGGDRVREKFGEKLERAIEQLAKLTWERLEGLRWRWEWTWMRWWEDLEEWDEKHEEAVREAREEARGNAEEAEAGVRWALKERCSNQMIGLKRAAWNWEESKLCGNALQRDLEESNWKVEEALDELREALEEEGLESEAACAGAPRPTPAPEGGGLRESGAAGGGDDE